MNELPRPGPEAGHRGGDRHHQEVRLRGQRPAQGLLNGDAASILVDFKLEFGKTADGTIVLADEISPDTCRLWDEKTHEKLDKDRFRRDLGGAEEAYEEVMRRLMGDRVIHGRFLRRDYQAGLRAGRVLRYRLPLPPGHQAGAAWRSTTRKDGFQRPDPQH